MNGLVEKVCDGYDRHNIIVDILFPNFSIRIVILLVDKYRRFGDLISEENALRKCNLYSSTFLLKQTMNKICDMCAAVIHLRHLLPQRQFR